jgi:LysR family hydrogen peroxide-inducible transcriptional activator
MVASDMGITLLPQLATLNLGERDAIQYIKFSAPEPVRQISLVVRQGYSRMDCVRLIVKTVKKSALKLF